MYFIAVRQHEELERTDFLSLLLLLLASTCIDIIPNSLQIHVYEPIRLVCRIRSTDAFNEQHLRVQWTRNDNPLVNIAECLSNYSSSEGTLYETLIIRKARKTDTGVYSCRYGSLLTATAHIIVHPSESQPLGFVWAEDLVHFFQILQAVNHVD